MKKTKQEEKVKELPLQEQLVFEQAKREAEEESRSEALKSLEDFKKTLPKHELALIYRYDEVQGEIFYFKIEGAVYSLDFWEKEYNIRRPGKGGNNGKWYSYTDCQSLLNIIKIYYWEYKGIEVLPNIELIPLLNTALAKNMQKARKW